LSNEDHEALEKFTKFFLVKAAQIIVQSRLGEKKTTKSKPVYSGSEWVNQIFKFQNIILIYSFLVSSFNQRHSRSYCQCKKMSRRCSTSSNRFST
jgi:hypothetical protein